MNHPMRRWLDAVQTLDERSRLDEASERQPAGGDYHWVETPHDDEIAATFQVGDVSYAVYFDASPADPSIFNFSFSAYADPQTRWQNTDEQPALTPDAFQSRRSKVSPVQVYATVSRIVNAFIAKYHPNMLRMTGATERQTRLYQKLITRQPIPGYQLETINRHFLLIRDGFSVPARFRTLT